MRKVIKVCVSEFLGFLLGSCHVRWQKKTIFCSFTHKFLMYLKILTHL